MDGFDSYDFSSDENFQLGISAIKQKAEKNGLDVIEELEKAKLYYFKNFVAKVSGTIERITTESEKMTVYAQEESESKSRLGFQELVEFIKEGKEIPGIRTIPNRINIDPPSKPKLTPRPKPWEKAV